MIEVIKGIAVLAVGFFNLIIGILILSKNPKKVINQSFFIICLSFVFWCVTLFLYQYPYVFSSLLWIQLVYLSAVMYMSSTLFFSFVFPTVRFPKALIFAKIYTISYIVFSVWLLFFTKWWVVDVVHGPITGLQTILHTQGYIVWILATWVNFAWIAINFIVKGKTATGYQKQQLSYLWIGYILFGIAVTVSDGIIPLVWHDTSFFYLSAVTNLFFSGLVGYIIIKHRFLDIKLILARSISYTVLLTLVGIFYSGGLFAVGIFWTKEPTSTSGLFFSTLLAVIISFTFQPLRLFLEKITDNIFYKGRYSSQELLHSFSQIMATTLTLDDLTQKLIGAIDSQMRTSKAVFIVDGFYQKNSLDITREQIKFLQSADTIIVFEEIPEGEMKELMRRNELSLIFPLNTKEKHIGLLLLGEKLSGETFFQQDIEVLEIAGPEFAIALQNAQRFEEISQFNVKLQEEIKTATEQLRTANNELKKLDKLKDEFLSLAAHELRTPMTAIKGYSYELMKNPANSKAKEYIERIYKSTERLVDLVNDMLDVGRIESGRIEVLLEKVDLIKTIADVTTEINGRVTEKQIQLTLSMPEETNLVVSADSAKLIQVLTNLIGNAVKFTPDKGHIQIAVHPKKEPVVEVTISDTGVGIDSEDLARLFGKFVRAKTGNGIQGTGLGLYLSKKLINLMGGDLWAKSDGAGHGSTFGFTLKLV